MAACAALLAAAAPAEAPPSRPLACTVLQGGERLVVPVAPAAEPYKVPEVAVGRRFAFKAVRVEPPGDEPRLAFYVYQRTDEGPVLLHELKYRPPYPDAPAQSTSGFTGLQHVYEPAYGSELQYFCAWGAP